MFGSVETELENREAPRPPIVGERGDVALIDPIRTETVFSRLPVHQLSKTSKTNIRIIQRQPDGGQISLRWQVSYNDFYGPARQLAFKTDKLVIDPCIDQTERPLSSRFIRLGSLRTIAQQLNLGADTNAVKQALLQNASTFINAKLSYKTADGKLQEIEEAFTRYNLRFWRETLEDGSVADAVYLRLNDPYFGIINHSARRPLDLQYLRLLSKKPSTQRFYELVSFNIFAALKNHHSHAKLRYSEYCNLAPQTRSSSLRGAQKQMYEIHRPHLESGYITKVSYQKTTDEEGSPDWFIFYTPGPRAKTEFETFNGGRKSTKTKRPRAIASSSPPAEKSSADDESNVELQGSVTEGREVVDELLSALTERGIFKSPALKVLDSLPDDGREKVQDYIDYWDQLKDAGPGLLLHLIENNDPLPTSFETRRRRQERQAADDKREKQRLLKEILTAEYDKHRASVIDRYIADELTLEQFDIRVASCKEGMSKQSDLWKPRKPKLLDQMARGQARADIAKEISILPYEEFRERNLAQILKEHHMDAVELGIELPEESVPEPENLSQEAPERSAGTL